MRQVLPRAGQGVGDDGRQSRMPSKFSPTTFCPHLILSPLGLCRDKSRYGRIYKVPHLSYGSGWPPCRNPSTTTLNAGTNVSFTEGKSASLTSLRYE